MARKTDAELQQRIQELKNNQEQAVQVANNCRDEIMRIEAILVDRAEAETEKKSIVHFGFLKQIMNAYSVFESVQ